MNKKIISSFLGAVFLVAFVLSSLSGCKSSTDKNHYTVLEWLDKVEETFNFLYYSETEPLVKSLKTSDKGFETVQIAADWGIIDPEDDLKFNGKLTKEFAADTLVRAMNCVTPSTADISDSKKVKALYLENVMSSVNEGIFALKSGKFDPKKQLTTAEADNAMLIAYDKWVNFSYGESFDRSTVKENVINLGGVTSENSTIVPAEYSVKYTGSKTFFDENGGYSDTTNKTITFQAGQVPEGLNVDTVLAMLADEIIPMNYAVVVTDVKANSDGSVTISTRNAELEEVYEEIDFQQSGPLDFSDAVFFGPNGERLTFKEDNSSALMSYISGEAKKESLGLYRPGEQQTVKTKNKVSGTLDLGDGISITTDVLTTPKGKWELKADVNAVNYFLPKDSPFNANFSGKYKIGSWFFEDLTGGKKPQFALTGKKNGTANVTISTGGESVTVPVKVGTGDAPIVSTGALISTKGTFTLAPGETAQTAFDFIPEGKTIADISFTSANISVATVTSGGLIKAVGIGDTVITATLKGNNKEYTSEFTVHVVA